VPHSGQNFTPGGRAVPQFGQNFDTDLNLLATGDKKLLFQQLIRKRLDSVFTSLLQSKIIDKRT